MTTAMWFLVSPIPDHTLDQVRASGRDVSGIPVVRLPATGGEPLRCCLRNAAPDERLLLFGYEPPLPPSPYREIGPVFAHADPCPQAAAGGYPPDWYGREQILRAYDRRGWIHPATRRHDGTDPIGAIQAVFAEPDVVLIHSRNIRYGCYMFAITRSGR